MASLIAREADYLQKNDTPIYDATELTQGGSMARIQLGDQTYTLRITRSGKLILTK